MGTYTKNIDGRDYVFEDWKEEFVEEGRQARKEGKDSFKCPYPDGLPQLRDSWISGWMEEDMSIEMDEHYERYREDEEYLMISMQGKSIRLDNEETMRALKDEDEFKDHFNNSEEDFCIS